MRFEADMTLWIRIGSKLCMYVQNLAVSTPGLQWLLVPPPAWGTLRLLLEAHMAVLCALPVS